MDDIHILKLIIGGVFVVVGLVAGMDTKPSGNFVLASMWVIGGTIIILC